MANIDVGKLAAAMLRAAQGKLQAHWNDVRPFAQTEMKKLAETALQIQLGQADGSLTKEQAEILLAMQANASQAVLTALETVGMIAAQDAINAAIDVLKDAVNNAVGIAFL
jgi:replicative superfamily II helicase